MPVTVAHTVTDIGATIALYTVIKVYRSVTGSAGTFVEITTSTTRVALVGGTSDYTYVDASGDPAYWYKVSYYKASPEAESALSAAMKAQNVGDYISLQDVRDEGVTVPQASDVRAMAIINDQERFIDRVTGWWFFPRTMTLILDGIGGDTLFFDFPIISVSSMIINDGTTALDTDLYVVYNRVQPDDRWNPRIVMKRSNAADIFVRYSTGGDLAFTEGRQNQTIVGAFGFTEEDGTAPLSIKFIALKLVMSHLKKLMLSDGASTGVAGPKIMEQTDGHAVQWAQSTISRRGAHITGDPEIDGILMRYRRPAKMAMVRSGL